MHSFILFHLSFQVKDYISFPKPNGYQSLHTALMLNGQTIEVQIRTSAMHKIAEFGMASHWAYTDGKRRQQHRNAKGEPLGDLYNTPWLSSIKEWQDEVLCSRDFVDCVRRELLGKRVFVFLRNGKILNLTKGSTVIDAAFQIHTEVGLTMYAVEINGKPVSFVISFFVFSFALFVSFFTIYYSFHPSLTCSCYALQYSFQNIIIGSLFL